VDPALYACWVDSLLRALGEFDEELTPELAGRWREAMERVVGFFAEHY
jgi:hypothetical protein